MQASGGQSLLAVLDGKVEVKGSDIEISDQDSKFLYKNVDTIRYKTGDHVKSGDIIGKVAPEGNQTVYYQKLEPDRSNKIKMGISRRAGLMSMSVFTSSV